MDNIIKKIFKIIYPVYKEKNKTINIIESMILTIVFLVILLFIYLSIILFDIDKIFHTGQNRNIKYLVYLIIFIVSYFIIKKLEPYLYKLIDDEYLKNINIRECGKIKTMLVILWPLYFLVLTVVFMKLFVILKNIKR